ncbi:hypothetical protein ACOL3H_06500 [Aliarcobacter butzleri]
MANKTIKINDKKLEKYQELFYQAGKVAGRLILKDKGLHSNLITAVSLFEAKYSECGLFEYDCSTPLSFLVELLVTKDDICKSCEKFFYDVVFYVARKEKIKIQYNWILGKDSLYGVNQNRIFFTDTTNYEEYIAFLKENCWDDEDIEDSQVIVDFENYIY